MKFSFRLGDAHNLTRENALACCSTNLGLPGFGSLMAGRKIGYPQAVLCVAGFALTILFGAKFIVWGVQHWSELRNPNSDPFDSLVALWLACRWTLLGMALFALAWLWAGITSLRILNGARRQAEPGKAPPVIGGDFRA